MSADKMPPLPQSHYGLYFEMPANDEDEGWTEFVDTPGYTSADMRDYARAYAAEQTRELVEALEEADGWLSEYISQMSAYTISDQARESRERLLDLIAKHKGAA